MSETSVVSSIVDLAEYGDFGNDCAASTVGTPSIGKSMSPKNDSESKVDEWMSDNAPGPSTWRESGPLESADSTTATLIQHAARTDIMSDSVSSDDSKLSETLRYADQIIETCMLQQGLPNRENATKVTFDNVPIQARRFNIIFAGQAGLGKTTTMHKIFTGWDNVLPPDTQNKSIPGVRTDCISLCGKYDVYDESKHTQVTAHAYDSPGYGDTLDSTKTNVDRLISFILSQRKVRYDNESRSWPAGAASDSLMHCCIYFVQPHRLNEVDLYVMEKLSKVVPIVCVIAKADTLNDTELQLQRDTVQQQLSNRGVFLFSLDDHIDDVEFPKCRGRMKNQLIAVVARDCNYAWGSLSCENDKHSDLSFLRDTLVWHNTFKLIDRAEKEYAKYRAAKMETTHMAMYCLAIPLIAILASLVVKAVQAYFCCYNDGNEPWK